MIERIDERKADTAAGARKREAVQAAMELKNYEFNAHGVEMGQFYTSSAVVSDGSVRPAPLRDPELYYQASTVPGSPLPHVWVGDARRKVSTLDLAPSTQFTVFTGIIGSAWAEVAPRVGERFGITLAGVVIGPGREFDDLYFDWARMREVGEDGVILVRPDKIIAWRSAHLVADPERALSEALAAVLSRTP
jgi:2,4-dichlorophenol 6-monooxygenase